MANNKTVRNITKRKLKRRYKYHRDKAYAKYAEEHLNGECSKESKET